jgi:hypothetical protein
MDRKTKTIERNLTEASQPVAEDLVRRTGSIKTVLSAGVIALSKLTADEREKMILEANTEPAIIEQPEIVRKTLKTVVKILSASGVEIKIADEDEAGTVQAIIDELGPEPKRKSKTETA